jgi:hypothetical protein
VSLSGTTLTVYIPVECLVQPQLQEAFNAAAVNMDTDADANNIADNTVDTVLFYTEYNDPQSQVQFLWGEAGCATAACATNVQTGCFGVVDRRNGTITPRPGTWVAASSSFASAAWTECREPDSVRFWYRAGYYPEIRPGCELLSDYWANLIAILATSRLDRPLCDCSVAKHKAAWWTEDLLLADAERSYQVGMDALNCPFGQRRGEIFVWKALSNTPGIVRGRAVRF